MVCNFTLAWETSTSLFLPAKILWNMNLYAKVDKTIVSRDMLYLFIYSFFFETESHCVAQVEVL